MKEASPPIPGSEKHVISIKPEVIAQLNEILEKFFEDLQTLENTINAMGLPFTFTSTLRQKNSSIDMQESQIQHFLEQQFVIPELPQTKNMEDLQKPLRKFFINI